MSAYDWEGSIGSSDSNAILSPSDNDCIVIPMGVHVPRLGNRLDSQCSSLIANSGFGVNCLGPVEGDIPRSLLEDGNPQSIITLESLMSSDIIVIPPSPMQVDCSIYIRRVGWSLFWLDRHVRVLLYNGSSSPPSSIGTELCDYFCISPSLLMPNTWRTLMAIQVFSELRNVHFSIQEVLLAYNLEKHKTDKVRCQFRASCSLILAPIDSAKDWKLKYFFVLFDVLGVSNYSQVQESWQISVR